jgi:hypothetical protein
MTNYMTHMTKVFILKCNINEILIMPTKLPDNIKSLVIQHNSTLLRVIRIAAETSIFFYTPIQCWSIQEIT